MQVFVSHSSSQKLLVRELQRNCPPSIRFWVDEKDIRKGADFKRAIDQALDHQCALCLLIVDEQAAVSDWVSYEIDRVLARERQENRDMLIPLVLSQNAWELIAEKVGRHRNYIRCYDQQDDSIRQAARHLTNAVLDWLIDAAGATPTSGGWSGAYAGAEETIRSAASVLKAAIYPFRQESPGTVGQIFRRVQEDAPGLFDSEGELQKGLTDLVRQGHMAGYYFDGDIAFVVRERFHDKTGMNVALKHRLAKAAASLVVDDQLISLDGGTTTLAIARELCVRLNAGALFGLRVFTNSLPVAQAFMEALALKNAGDRDAACKVEMLGGLCRVSTLCTSAEEGKVDALVARMKGLDIAFIGASGLVGAQGFGVTNVPEIAAKVAFQGAAARAVIVCDHTKFEVQQRRLTNPPEAGLTVVTDRTSAERIEALRSENDNWTAVEIVYCD